MKWYQKLGLGLTGILIVAPLTWYALQDRPKQAAKPVVTSSESKKSPSTEAPSFDKSKYSLTEPSSLWVVVNKERPLPAGYVPDDLVTPDVRLRLGKNDEQMKLNARAAGALKELFTAASTDKLTLVLSSGYRSEALQRQFYNGYVARDGQAAADRYSARPGTSEHQTGLAADIMNLVDECHLETCFGDLPEGKWLAVNAYKHGFIIRYPDGKEAITGYQYEPWHLRYVGPELAAELHRTNQTVEEFFGLNSAE